MTDLALVADIFRASLPSDAVVRWFRIDRADRCGIPVVQANLLRPGHAPVIGHGYGFTETEAAVGALGELCEEVHLHDWLERQDPVLDSTTRLLARLGPRGVADPLTLCLPAGSSYDPDAIRAWLPARRYPTDEIVLVPMEWIAIDSHQMAGRDRLITPITNGLGAGLDLPHAIAHGVMELLQRDGNVQCYRAFDRGVVVDVAHGLDQDCERLIGLLREAGIDVTVKLASTEFGISNLYVVGDDTGPVSMPIQITACGEAAHPFRLRGLRKALLEFIGSRARKAATHGTTEQLRELLPPDSFEHQLANAVAGGDEPRALAAMAEWLDQDAAELRRRLSGNVFLKRETIALTDLPDALPAMLDDAGNSASRLAWLSRMLSEAGMEILWVDCSPPGQEVSAVKVVVPGLESETMSYHRVGWRGVKRLRARHDALVTDRPAAGFRPVMLRPEDAERAGGAAFLDTATIDARVERLYPLYRETAALASQLARKPVLSI